jgi:hypothetical protein
MKHKKCGLAREKKNDRWTTPHIRGLQQRHIKNDCRKGDNKRECKMVSANMSILDSKMCYPSFIFFSIGIG